MRIELGWLAIGFFKWELVVGGIKWFDSFGNECFLKISRRRGVGNDEGALK